MVVTSLAVAARSLWVCSHGTRSAIVARSRWSRLSGAAIACGPALALHSRHFAGSWWPWRARKTSRKREADPIVVPSPKRAMADLKGEISQRIKETHVLVYSKTTCPYCTKVKRLLQLQCVDFTLVEVDEEANGEAMLDVLKELTGQRTVPNVFVNGQHIGGCDQTVQAYSNGTLAQLILEGQGARDVQKAGDHAYQYDLIVIGGGSGGLACSKALEDARCYGWQLPEDVSHSWSKMVEGIQNHIGSLNWGYRVALRDKEVKYLNALAEFVDPHTIKHVNKRGKEETITGARIVIATGGRPRYPNVPGAVEYGITSDDLFSLQSPPGKTLVVGASYVALECAGFLKELGFDTTVLVRSILLRGFDQQMAEKAGEYMSNHGLKFIRPAIPTKVELVEDGQPRRLKVEYKLTETGEVKTEEFNTVLFAIGRDPDTKDLKLEKAGVHFEKSGYIPTIFEQTSVPHIYAIGDVLKGKHELTPMAIQAGKLLARRMFGGSSLHSDYINVPTTVFTPLEFGSIGLAEEDAQLIYGQQNIEVYHTLYKPLEFTVAGREDNACYGKLVCNSNDKERVLGFHVIGTNAGEITQGYAVAMKLGATKADFDSTIGIHPTSSEIFTTLSVTKSSGDDITQAGC